MALKEFEENILERQHFYSFDLVRFFAAMLVLLNHFAEYASNLPATTSTAFTAYPFLAPFRGVGAVGVEIFFVISGFVIASSIEKKTGVNAAKLFFIARAKRILPVLWISGVFSLLARLTVGEPLLPLLSAFVRSSLLSPIGPYVDGVVWSLVVEAFFYVLVGITILKKSEKRLIFLAFLIGSVSIFYNLLVVIVEILDETPTLIDLKAILGRFPFKVFLLRHGVFFSLGIFVWSSIKLKPRKNQIFFAALCCAFCVIEIFTSSSLSQEALFVKVFLWLISIAILISSSHEKLIALKLQSHVWASMVRYLGALSYPLYLNHFVFGMVISYHLSGFESSELRFLLSISAIFLVSIIVLEIERYAIKSISGKSYLILGKYRKF